VAGTQEGLVRFGGARFTIFDRENTPVFKSPDITVLLEGTNSQASEPRAPSVGKNTKTSGIG
jgi:hypothetical protein